MQIETLQHMYDRDFNEMNLKKRRFRDKWKELETFENVELEVNKDINKLFKEEVIIRNTLKEGK